IRPRVFLATDCSTHFSFVLLSPHADHSNLHSFPTRRSSDLSSHALIGGYAGAAVAKSGFSAIIAGGWTKTLIFIVVQPPAMIAEDRKSTRLNSSHDQTSYAVFCLKKKNNPICTKRTMSQSDW